MKKYSGLLLFVVIVLSCNDDAFFTNEQYKTIFALISDDGHNIFEMTHSLNEPESVGYISASCGGTLPSTEDIHVALIIDSQAVEDYNFINYDLDVESYAKILSKERYHIDQLDFTIKAGDRYGRLPIRINPEGLSPDSTYFIPFKINEFSSYEVNPDKSNVLYRVLISNDYAIQSPLTQYNMRAFRGNVQLPGIKTMHPLSRNKVRILVDNIAFQPNKNLIDDYSMVVEILDDGKILISPYRNLEVEQINGDEEFPNEYFVEKTPYKKFHVFLLRYNYVDNEGRIIEMKEELRKEIVDD